MALPYRLVLIQQENGSVTLCSGQDLTALYSLFTFYADGSVCAHSCIGESAGVDTTKKNARVKLIKT